MHEGKRVLKCVLKVLVGAVLLNGGLVHASEGETDLLQSCVNGRVASLTDRGEVTELNPQVVQRILNECQMATGIKDAQRACVAGEVAQRNFAGDVGALDGAARKELEAACS